MLTGCILRAPHVEQSIVDLFALLVKSKNLESKKNFTLSDVTDFLAMLIHDPLLQNPLHHSVATAIAVFFGLPFGFEAGSAGASMC